jgi:hypothetical protein
MRVRGNPHPAIEENRKVGAAERGFGMVHEPLMSRQIVWAPMDHDVTAGIQGHPVRGIGQVLAHHPPVDTALRRGP